MDRDIMSFSAHKDIDVHSKSFDAFISYMESSNDFWIIKDDKSRFVYANDIMIYYSGLPKGFNIEGKLDSECPAPWSEFEDVIQNNDKKVMERKITIPVLNTFVYGGKEKIVQPFILEVTPLIKNGESIGIVGRGKKLDIYSMHHFEREKPPQTIHVGKPDAVFSDREFDIVFFAIQSLSSKEIAKKLNISHRTVENRLQDIYNKLNIHSLSELKEYCTYKGYDAYAPTRFINPMPYIPLSND